MSERFIDVLDSPKAAIIGLISAAVSHLALELFVDVPLATVVSMDITYGLVIGGSAAVLDGFFNGGRDNIQVDA